MGVRAVLQTPGGKDEHYFKGVDVKYPEHICGTIRTN
jgi:hypothetical protein